MNSFLTEKLSIKSWAEADRPREKLLTNGRSSLSNAELLAILVHSGTRKETAVDLCQRILKSVNNNLNELGKLSVNDLKKFNGVGEAKSLAIIAALELGRRRKEDEPEKRTQITSSRDAFLEFHSLLADLPHEEFWILLLNRANKIIGKQNISRGGVSGTVADIRVILKHALEHLASGIILCHNHPSGNLKPSNADRDLTSKVRQAGNLVEVKVLDHIIIAGEGYYSFMDEGMM